MKANMTVHDIRFKSENALKVLRKGLIGKLQITNDKYITINNASFALASRFCDMTPIDVYVNSIWNNVGVGRFNDLEKLFTEEEKVEEVKTIIVEAPIIEEATQEENAPEPAIEDEVQESSDEEESDSEEEVDTESTQPQNNNGSFSYSKKKKRRH